MLASLRGVLASIRRALASLRRVPASIHRVLANLQRAFVSTKLAILREEELSSIACTRHPERVSYRLLFLQCWLAYGRESSVSTVLVSLGEEELCLYSTG